MVETKQCRRCKAAKPTAAFSKASREKDGLQDRCKLCNKEVAAIYRASHVEKERTRHAKYHEANKARLNKKTSDWQKANPDKVRAKAKRHFEKNREKESQRCKKWRDENRDRHLFNAAKWRVGNIEHCKAYDARYWRNNKPLVYAKNARRRAALLRATPSWADHEKITSVYAQCVEKADVTGIEHHVDHIVPLRSRLVCGLHWEVNLQILTGSENARKHNSYWPDMP
jgi:hypothetical protein